jgi:GxxExxY protein
MTENEITERIIGASIEVHRALGPGLLESTYEACLYYELEQKGLWVDKQVALPISYKEVELEIGYRLDLLVEHKVIVELKSVSELLPIHTAQLLTYLKLSEHRLGLLINFNVAKLTEGVRRIANNL